MLDRHLAGRQFVANDRYTIADIMALRDGQLCLSDQPLVVREVRPEPIPSPPITSDPPHHKPYKQLLLPPFTHRGVGYAELEDLVDPSYEQVAVDLRHAQHVSDHLDRDVPGVLLRCVAVPVALRHGRRNSPPFSRAACISTEAMTKLEPKTRAICNELIDKFIAGATIPNGAIDRRTTLSANCWRSGSTASCSTIGTCAFSLLPAQNATGNWVKIVQRVAGDPH